MLARLVTKRKWVKSAKSHRLEEKSVQLHYTHCARNCLKVSEVSRAGISMFTTREAMVSLQIFLRGPANRQYSRQKRRWQWIHKTHKPKHRDWTLVLDPTTQTEALVTTSLHSRGGARHSLNRFCLQSYRLALFFWLKSHIKWHSTSWQFWNFCEPLRWWCLKTPQK